MRQGRGSRVVGWMSLWALWGLTACGGGGGGTPSPQAEAVFSPTTAASVRTETGAAAPRETGAENHARRQGQDRAEWNGRRSIVLAGTATTQQNQAFEAFVAAFSDTYDDASLRQTILSKHELTTHGASGDDPDGRVMGMTMADAGMAVFTTKAFQGDSGIYVRTDVNESGTRPTLSANATWTGLMLGADRDSLDLLQGDAELTYDMSDQTMDVRFTDIINLDKLEPYKKDSEAFSNIAVDSTGQWKTAEGERYLEGSFAGSEHQEAVGLFWTPDMTGAFGAKTAVQ